MDKGKKTELAGDGANPITVRKLTEAAKNAPPRVPDVGPIPAGARTRPAMPKGR